MIEFVSTSSLDGCRRLSMDDDEAAHKNISMMELVMLGLYVYIDDRVTDVGMICIIHRCLCIYK